MNELDINNPQLPDFIVPGADEKKQDEPAKIKVIGVGGGGGNAVNHMYHQGIGGVSFVLCNTDAQALRNSPVPVKVQLGAKGEGAGNIPEVAKKLAEESAAEVEALFDDNTRMAFITAGMGGGTGTGAAPVVARIAKEKGVLTVGIVTIPFLFEGEPKILQAFAGVEEMRKHVDALLVINNERLCKIYPDLSWTTAFAKPLAFSRFIANADMIIIDLKHYSEKKYVQFTGVSNHSILENLDFAVAIGKKVAVRITITPGINDTLIDARRYAHLLSEHHIRHVILLSYSNLGIIKYEKYTQSPALAREQTFSGQDMENYANMLRGLGFDVQIEQ